MSRRLASRRKYAVHGLAVEIESELPPIDEGADVWLWPFETDVLPERVSCTQGVVRRYDEDEVMRHVSPAAIRVASAGGTGPGQFVELYQEGERFWAVDDRWGICEINVLKGEFRSWVLPRPTLDAARVAELAVLWPIAQLLRHKGLHLMPAVSAARVDFGVLILCPFNLEGELRALIEAGYQIVGQRWTAVREDGGRIELLRMPGRVERSASPRLRDDGLAGAGPVRRWVDLAGEYHGVVRHCALCDAVLVVEPAAAHGAACRAGPGAAGGGPCCGGRGRSPNCTRTGVRGNWRRSWRACAGAGAGRRSCRGGRRTWSCSWIPCRETRWGSGSCRCA